MDEIKLVCFDLDDTLIEQNSWKKLNLAMGVSQEKNQLLYDKFHAGEISYKDWVSELLKIYKKNGKANIYGISKVLSSYTYKGRVREIVKYLKDKGYHVALISGSMNMMVDLVAQDLGIELSQAINTFIFDEKDFLQDIVCLGTDSIVKLNLLEGFCRKLGIGVTECACIGDGDNDIDMFVKTEHGITFKDSSIVDKAWKVIESLEGIKDIL